MGRCQQYSIGLFGCGSPAAGHHGGFLVGSGRRAANDRRLCGSSGQRRSGLYDVLRYPLNIFSTEEELNLIKQAEKADVGITAIKTLASGKIENVPIAFGFLRQNAKVISVWGARNIDEIQKLLYFESNPPNIDDQFLAELEELKKSD